MADALVFGGPNALASRISDALSDALRVREFYAHSATESSAPGVGICTDVQAFAAGAPALVFADGGPAKARSEERAAVIELLAAACARGAYVRSFQTEREVMKWARELSAESLRTPRPLRRVNITGESGVGKSMLAGRMSPILGIPLVSVDELFWGAEAPRGATARNQQIDDVLSRDAWLTEGAYRQPARRLSERADVIIHLGLPSHVARQQRAERSGGGSRPLKERLILGAFRKSQPIWTRLTERDLADLTRVAPAFLIRTEEEREALVRGFERGMSRPAPGLSHTAP